MAHVTLASMFWHRVETDGDRPAQQWKEGGAWRTRPWREVGEIVRELASGLLALGRRKDEAIGILSASRAEWVQADFAAFSAGCRTIPIYPSYPPDLIQYIVNDAEVKTLFVEDPAQLAKVLEVQGKMEGLEQIVVMHGHQGEPSTRVMTWDGLRRLGRDNLERLRSELASRVAAVGPEDIATIVYTSGRFSRSLSMLSAKAVVSPRCTPMNDSSRAKECASGRKSRWVSPFSMPDILAADASVPR